MELAQDSGGLLVQIKDEHGDPGPWIPRDQWDKYQRQRQAFQDLSSLAPEYENRLEGENKLALSCQDQWARLWPHSEHQTPPSSQSLTLGPKMEAVVSVMQDKQFRTLAEISDQSGYESLTGLSAGIRGLRKFGYVVDKRKLEDRNEYEYRLV